MRADLRGRNCWRRKAEKKVVGQSESRYPGEELLAGGGTVGGERLKRRLLDRVRVDLRGGGTVGEGRLKRRRLDRVKADLRGGTVGGGRLKRRWLDRMRADLQGRDCWRRKTEKKKVVGQSESRSPGGGTVVGGRLKKRRW